MGKILALDFDGVVCDSLEECRRMSFQCFAEMAGIEIFEKFQVPHQYLEKFDRNRGYVRPAKEFFALWWWVVNGAGEDLNWPEFAGLTRRFTVEMENFSQKFFSLRLQMQERQPELWLRWNPLFPGVEETWLRLIAEGCTPYIVTTKDRTSVSMILDSHGLVTKGLYCKDDLPSKSAALEDILFKEGLKPSELVFVDDNEGHILDVTHLGVSVRVAAWGYGPFGNRRDLQIHSFTEIEKSL